MRWLSRLYDVAAILALLALLGLAGLVLASALAGRGLPFTGGFTSSDEPLSFDRLVTRAPDRGAAAEEAPLPAVAGSPTPAASPTGKPTPTPAAPSAPAGVGAESGDGAPSGEAPEPVDGAEPGNGAESFGGAPALASLQAVETSTDSKGATTITWESGFSDLNYTPGDTLTIAVDWQVQAGAASYDSFVLKGDTPTAKKDPAGVTGLVTYPGANGPTSVDVSFAFTELHLDAERNVEIGNAHFKLYLTVDADGDGIPETRAGYGVNVHVEAPR